MWNSLDGEPVRAMILIVVRDSDAATEHTKIISALVRQMMHKGFRAGIKRETNAVELCRLLERKIEY